MKRINNTKNGSVYKHDYKDIYQIEFNNFIFYFDLDQYLNFVNYFQNLNGEYYSRKNYDTLYRRKLIIPIGHKNINMLLNLSELEELRELLKVDIANDNYIDLSSFNYDIGVN